MMAAKTGGFIHPRLSNASSALTFKALNFADRFRNGFGTSDEGFIVSSYTSQWEVLVLSIFPTVQISQGVRRQLEKLFLAISIRSFLVRSCTALRYSELWS